MSFQAEYQADLIAVCYQDKNAFNDVRGHIEPESFTIPQLRWLWELGINGLDSHGEIPSVGVVAQEAVSSWSDNEFATLINVHADIVAREVSKKSVIEQSIKFAEHARYLKAAERHGKLIQARDFSGARALMEAQGWRVEEARSERRIAYGYDDFDRLTAEAKARRDMPEDFKFKTNIAGLDDRMGGGYARKDMVGIVAFTGLGKTTLAINLMDALITAGHGVAMANSEMRPDILMAKLYARRSRIGHNIIYEYQFTPEMERQYLEFMAEQRDRLTKLLFIEQLGIGTMTRDKIKRVVDDAREFLKNLSAVCIDTLDHCRLSRPNDPVNSHRENANWTHDLLVEEDIAGIVTTQANRDGAKETKLENLAGHLEIGRVSEFVIAINENASEGTRANPDDDLDEILQKPSRFDMMRLDLVKARMGAKGQVPISTELGCSFMGDSEIERRAERGEMDIEL